MGGHDDHAVARIDGGIYGLTKDQQNALQPSDALLQLLVQAQADHRKCLSDAKAHNKNANDACASTWGNVYTRYQQWAAYRQPFKTYEAVSKWGAQHHNNQ
eukprot:PhF_6_TR785/c1_g1_i1/m.1206